ncbi:MAG: hypothetical protein EOM87_07340 [Clostridia bacterium]|nr:hypothetical protein [Clostridia bacterium]
MEQYRVYDRQTLDFVDGGVVRNYSIDADYLSNNASTLTLVDKTAAKKGDIVIGQNGMVKTFIGAITAVDNTKRQISFKHPKELFADTVLNPFKYTGTIGYKFELTAAMETVLTLAFISTNDTKKKLPLIIERHGTASGAVWTDDGDTLNLSDFIQWAFDNHNVYLDFDIDFATNKLVCKIVKNTMTGYIIKDNIKLSTPTFDKNELPNYNKAVVYNKDMGAILGTYYLLADNTVTASAASANRLLPVQTKYISFDADKGYTPLDVAQSELQGNIYNHCIQYKLSKEQRLVDPLVFKYGDGVKIIYDGREYDSIFTGLKYSSGDPYYTCYFGKTRIDFTDRLKQYIDKRYQKK